MLNYIYERDNNYIKTIFFKLEYKKQLNIIYKIIEVWDNELCLNFILYIFEIHIQYYTDYILQRLIHFEKKEILLELKKRNSICYNYLNIQNIKSCEMLKWLKQNNIIINSYENNTSNFKLNIFKI